jgi:hypothetical protein
MVVADASLTSLRYALEASSEVNTVTSAGASAGNWTLTINNVPTANIAFNANAAAVQSAIEAIHGAGVATVTGGGTGSNLGTSGHIVTINWATGRLQGTDIAISIATGGLTGSPHVLATPTPGGVSAFGVVPTNCNYREVRMVSETLGQDKEVVQSDEILTDRRPPDNIQVGSSASGDVVCEATGGNTATETWGSWWQAAIGNAGVYTGQGHTTTFTSGTITVDNVGGSNDRITLVSSGASFNGGLTAGVWVLVSGFIADSAGNSLAYLNSGYQVVSGGGTTTLTLTSGPRVAGSPTPPRVTPTLTAGTAISVSRYGEIVDGTSLTTMTIERKYSISSWARMSGMALNGFTFEMRPKTPMRITWRFLGQQESDHVTTITGQTVTAALTSPKSFSPVSDFKGLSLDEDGRSFSVTSFTLDVKGGLYMQDEEAGVLGPQGIGVGTFEVTGSFDYYYEGGTIAGLYSAFTSKSLSFQTGNAANEGVMFHLPRVNFTNHRRATAGKDQAIKGSVDFRAAKGTDPLAAQTYLIKIGRR